MKMFLFWASWALTLAAVAALVAYAGFDFTWWVPLAPNFRDTDRGFLLLLLHITALSAGPVVTAALADMEDGR